MSNPAPPDRLSFEDNLSTLQEELLLAAKWQRPSILLAVHKSKFGQQKAEAALEERLVALGHAVTRITVDKDHSDVPHLIVGSSAPRDSIFFVSNIDWGGGEDHRDAYRALNIYRELFVDHHVRMVLWLTTSEAATLARYAPDFWAFRHRVLEFTGQRIPRRISLPSGALLWDIQNTVDPFDTPEARIAVREQLFARLPDNPEARSSRIDLLYNLGYLNWLIGNTAKAARDFEAALALAGRDRAEQICSSPLNGLAILAYEAQDRTRAADLLSQALQRSPEHPYLLANKGIVASALGRNQDAVTIAARAVRMSDRDPRLWGARGYLYASTGKFDEAITCFGKASELAPRLPVHHITLAVCYDLVERPDEMSAQLASARKLADRPMTAWLDIYEAALLDSPARAVQVVRAAVAGGPLRLHEIRRDPILALLLDSQQIEEIAT